MGLLVISATARPNAATSVFAAQLIRAAQPAVLRKINRLGEACVEEIAAEAGRRYRTGRPASRSRSTPRLSDRSAYDFDARTTAKGGRLEVHLAGVSDAFKAKFFSLNNGSRGHRITARNAKTLAYNRYDPASTEYNYFPPAVSHPGTAGSHFYEAGIRRAVSRFRR